MLEAWDMSRFDNLTQTQRFPFQTGNEPVALRFICNAYARERVLVNS